MQRRDVLVGKLERTLPALSELGISGFKGGGRGVGFEELGWTLLHCGLASIFQPQPCKSLLSSNLVSCRITAQHGSTGVVRPHVGLWEEWSQRSPTFVAKL